MKQYALYVSFLSIVTFLLVAGCREDIFLQPEVTGFTNVFVNSEPTGASIILNGEFTAFNTPAWLNRIEAKKITIKLQLEGYIDTTVSVQLKDSTNEIIDILLKSE